VQATGSDILIACGLRKEAGFLRPLFPGLAIITTGIGRRATRRTLEDRFRKNPHPRILLFTGTAGQLDPELAMGAVLCPEEWITEEGTAQRVRPALVGFLGERGRRVEGRGITVSFPVLRAAARARLHADTGARICDMEASEALAVSTSFGVPAVAVKVVSDTEDTSPFAFWRYFERNMQLLAVELEKVIKSLTGQPSGTPGTTGITGIAK
jgi:nucleoside phosphorylase